MIRDTRLLAELAHQLLPPPQIVPRHAGEQVVDGLELQAAVDPVQPRGAVDVHGRAHLALGEGFGGAQVGGRHAPVGQGDLHVQDHGDQMRDEDEADADGPAGQRAPDEQVAEDEPVARHEHELDRARPPRCAQLGRARGAQVAPGEDIEVEAGEGHDGVVGVFLVREEDFARAVPGELKVLVESRDDALDVGRGGGENGRVLNVRVVLGHVGDEVVHVVRRLPPADGQAAAEVGDEGADQSVDYKVARYTAMAGVVRGEHNLLLEGVSRDFDGS